MKKVIALGLGLLALTACGSPEPVTVAPVVQAAPLTPSQQYLKAIYDSGALSDIPNVDRSRADTYLLKLGYESVCPAIGVPGVTRQRLVEAGAKGATWSTSPNKVAEVIVQAAETNLCPHSKYANIFGG